MSTLKVNAITDVSGGNTTLVNGVALRPGAIDPDNKIINGAFDFWQRGTSFTTVSTEYSADRWRVLAGGGTVTTTRQSFSLGDTLGANSPTYFLRHAVSGQTLAGNFGVMQHRIEGVRSYAGQTITILGWVRRSSGTGNMAVSIDQIFGTGGSPSASTLGAGQTVTLTSSWAPFAVTIAVPSITGKTLGTSLNDYLAINFWCSAGSDFNARTNNLGLQTINVDLWGIHIKTGTHSASATDMYNTPDLTAELARCQRYYVKLGGTAQYDILIQGAMSTTCAMSLTLTLPVTMRTSPLVTKVGTWSVLTATQPAAAASSPALITINTSGTSATIVGSQAWTLDSTTFLTVDAEL